jgi:hypothetical protein
MGNISFSSIKKVNYEDVQRAIHDTNKYLIINTLASHEQQCLIKNTIYSHDEENVINMLTLKTSMVIVIYGRNDHDDRVFQKYSQLLKHGYKNVYVYLGGLFEWLLLQDIYGKNHFPTTCDELDILKYKSVSSFRLLLKER